MGREGRDYWEAQLSEYWDSGLTVQEYSSFSSLKLRVELVPVRVAHQVPRREVDGEIFAGEHPALAVDRRQKRRQCSYFGRFRCAAADEQIFCP